MHKERIALISLVVVVCLTTFFIRIPLPSRGYFNVGDVAVVFSGLFLGRLLPVSGIWWALPVGGLGSALADVLGGWAVFAPLTFVAKGFEAALAALAVRFHRGLQALFLALGGVGMMAVYFIGEILMPNIGLQGAVAELLPNLIQAAGGALGGRLVFAAFQRARGRISAD